MPLSELQSKIAVRRVECRAESMHEQVPRFLVELKCLYQPFDLLAVLREKSLDLKDLLHLRDAFLRPMGKALSNIFIFRQFMRPNNYISEKILNLGIAIRDPASKSLTFLDCIDDLVRRQCHQPAALFNATRPLVQRAWREMDAETSSA
jgi:hypothetical protein